MILERQQKVSQQCESKRRAWKPNNPQPNSESAIAPDTISRCLALTPLEPAVANFIGTGLTRSDSSKLDPTLIATLRHNIEDEANHEIALTRAAAAMRDRADYGHEAAEIIKQWATLTDNPITTTAVLECGVFFCILPLYSQFGGSSLRITSASISGDERLHVISHRAASQALGARPSKELNKLRRDTVAWFSRNLADEVGGSWSVDRMVANSESLMVRGISDFAETRVSQVNAPYEINSRNMEKYA